jgi:hypothetical protein
MNPKPFRFVKPNKYEIAMEILASTVRVLFAAGFSESEIPKLFEYVAKRPARAPLWIEPLRRSRGSTRGSGRQRSR